MFLGRASSGVLARSASAAARRPRTALPRPSLSAQQLPRSTAAAIATAREDRSSGDFSSSGSYMWAAAAAVAALGLASTSDQQVRCARPPPPWRTHYRQLCREEEGDAKFPRPAVICAFVFVRGG